MNLIVVERSYTGKKCRTNEDSAGHFYNQKLDAHLFCVADGIGGYGHGDMASRIVVDSFIKDFAYIQKESVAPDLLISCMFENAQTRLRDYKIMNNIENLGTTLAVLMFQNEMAICANLGDTRIYSFHEDEILQESVDHTYVQDLINTFKIKRSEARFHPKRHVLSKALTGESEKLEPYINVRQLNPDSTYMIASDGLYKMINKHFMLSVLASFDLESAADLFTERAFLNGAPDDLTFQIIKQKK